MLSMDGGRLSFMRTFFNPVAPILYESVGLARWSTNLVSHGKKFVGWAGLRPSVINELGLAIELP
jgi:hypothetical protein